MTVQEGGDAAGVEDARPRAISTVNVPSDLLQVARAAVRLVRAKTGRPYSLRQFTEEALTAQIRAIADTYNDGRTIPRDQIPLERGRSIS